MEDLTAYTLSKNIKMFSCGSGLFSAVLMRLGFRRNKVEAMPKADYCQYDFKQTNRWHQNDSGEAKPATSGQCDPCLHNRPNAPPHQHTVPLTPRHDLESHYWSTGEDDIGNFSSPELKLIENDNVKPQRLRAKNDRPAVLNGWNEKTESIAAQENGLPPQGRFTSSPGQQMMHGQMHDEYYISDDNLVVISRPTHRPRDNLHLACPFYVYDPEKCRQCGLMSNLQSISDVIEHLFQSHSRPCYCLNCYETFDTLICRDDHVLDEKCQRRTPGPLFGLSENQKSMLLETDTHCIGEKAQWLFIWSIVFPDSCEPCSPYLD
jgi:hypothetical protein